MRKILTLLSTLLLVCACLSAQEFRATISGHVLDSSGAAVPNAKITVTSVATNDVINVNSDNSGAYTVPLLRPGMYKVSATAQGFKAYVKDNVELMAAKVAGIDITLEVGAVTDTVEVTADAMMLETQTASRGGIVTTQQVAEMPLNARNPFMLGAMMSGVTFNGAAIWQRPFDNGAIAQWSVNGSRDSSTEYFLDGASNNGQMGGNNIAYVPVVDAVQEFQVMQNLYNAEYGHTGGGILNVALKSGTSQFHGTVWEYMRRTGLDANTFQNNSVGTNRDANGKAIRPTHYLDQYGFQLEGPLRVPGILRKDGPVKLFYLGTFENYREGTPNPLIVSWPEAEMRNGDFSKLVTATGARVPIYDPNSATYDAAGNILTPRTVFPNNVIPSNRIDPVAKAVTQFMPMPNRPAPVGSRYATNNLFVPDYFDKDKFYNLILKFDANIGSKDRAYFRHASNDRTEDRAVNGIDNKPGTDGQQPFQRINDAYVADWVRTFGPTTIGNVRVSYNRFIEKGFGAANAGFDLTKLGLPTSLIKQLPYQDKIYFGRWNFDGYNSLGRSQSNNYTNTYEIQGSVTKILGSHTVKVGADVRQINYEGQNSGDILSYTGQASWTRDSFTNANSGTGDGYASFLLGGVGGSSNYPLFPWWKQHYGAIYVQDDWKVSRKLTLNLGMRYDLYQGQYEKWNRMNGPFDPTLASPVKVDPAAIAALQAQNVPANIISNLQNLKGGLTFAGVGRPRTSWPMPKDAFGPRLGLAYQINDRLVLRTGGGLYYSNPNNDPQRTSGFSTSTNINNSVDSGRTYIPGLLSNPFPNGVNQPTGSSLGAATFIGQNPTWFDPSVFALGKVFSFSFGFQFQATKNSTLEVSYVGNRSYDLQSGGNDFNLMPADFEKTCDLYRGGNPNSCLATVPNPFRGNPLFVGQNLYTSTTISRANLARLYPQFDGALTKTGRSNAWIHYNSLQINYNLRLRSGLSILTNYTLSKQVEASNIVDNYTDYLQRGLYFLDRPHVLKATLIYELPFGEGKKWGAGGNKFLRKAISGWQWTNFYNHALKGFPSDIPNAIQLKDPTTPGGGFSGAPDWSADKVRLWNPCALRQNNDGSIVPTPASAALGCGTDFSNNWGNYAWLQLAPNYSNVRFTPFRSGQIRRHTAMQLDASLLKTTRINERMRFQFGFEAFNLLNHNYFGRDQVNQTIDDANGNFGSIRPSTVSTQNILPRQIQVRFKFNW